MTMTTRTRWILIGAAAVVVAGGIWWMARPAPPTFETAGVVRGDVEEVLVEDARTRARWHVDLTAPVGGEWIPVAFEPGDTVKAGQLLGTLSVPPQDPQTASQARAQVGVAEATLAAAQAAEQEASVAAREAKRARDRIERLVNSGGISQEQIDLARAADEARTRELEAARAQVVAARYTLQSARAFLPGGAGAPVQLRAPANGLVLRVDEEHERVVSAGSPLLQVGSLEQPEVVARVLSADAPRVKEGATMIVIVGRDTLRGRVTRVEPTAQTVRSALGVEEQRVPVVGDIPSGSVRLGHDFQIEARIVVARVSNGNVVPVGALVREGSAWSVFVLGTKKQVEKRAVQVLARGVNDAAVEGVATGERVVVYPPEDIQVKHK
jgi:HlyD family secretion protein